MKGWKKEQEKGGALEIIKIASMTKQFTNTCLF